MDNYSVQVGVYATYLAKEVTVSAVKFNPYGVVFCMKLDYTDIWLQVLSCFNFYGVLVKSTEITLTET